MKKLVSVLLSVVLMAALFAGCGAAAEAPAAPEAEQPQTELTEEAPESAPATEEAQPEVPAEEAAEEPVEEETVVSIFEGKDMTFMQQGEEYAYTAPTGDAPNILTSGSAQVNNYRVVDSEGTHAARDGWKWHIVDVVLYFYDTSAQNYGYSFGLCTMDCYNGITESGDLPTILMDGQEYTAVDESQILSQYWVDPTMAEVNIEIAVQLPVGYTDAVLCLYNREITLDGIEGMMAEDYMRDDSLFFLMNQN